MSETDRTLLLIGIVLAFVAANVALQSVRFPDIAAVEAASAACGSVAPDVFLQANAAYAEDLTTGKTLYGKNAAAQLPLASLAKLMTISVASGILLLDDVVAITPEALAPEGDAGFRTGEKWRAKDLIDYTLMVSANDGAHALALAAARKEGEKLSGFLRRMNDAARALGMHETFYTNDTGLDLSSTTAGAYGSARDVAALVASIVKNDPRLVEGTREETRAFTSLSGFTHEARNTSDVIGSLPGAIASKTGYTDLAGGNLAVVFEPIPGRPVVAVVLGSTRAGRNTDMETLAAGVRAALKREILCGE